MPKAREKEKFFALKDQEIMSRLEGIFIAFEEAGKNLKSFAENAKKTAKISAESNKDFRLFIQLLETLNQSLGGFQNEHSDKIKSASQRLKKNLQVMSLLAGTSESYENKGLYKDRTASHLFTGIKKTPENVAAPLNAPVLKDKDSENTGARLLDTPRESKDFDKIAEGISKAEKFLDENAKIMKRANDLFVLPLLPLLPHLSLISLLLKLFQKLNLVDFIAFLGVLADGNQDKEEKSGDWNPNKGDRAKLKFNPEGESYLSIDSKNKNSEKETETKLFDERADSAWRKDFKKSYQEVKKLFPEFENKLQAFLPQLNADSRKENPKEGNEYSAFLPLLLDSLSSYSRHSEDALAAKSGLGKNLALSSNSYSFNSQDVINVHSPAGDFEGIAKEFTKNRLDRSLARIANSCNYLG